MENVEELLKDIHQGLLKWYDFTPNANVLYVGTEEDDLAKFFKGKSLKITCVQSENDIANLLLKKEKYFQYIVCVTTFETYCDVNQVFRNFFRLLDPKGRLLLGANNRLGLRFWCGERDLYTGGVMDGISGYAGDFHSQGRMYSRRELRDMLEAASFEHVRFYAVLPNLEYPMMVYREDCIPQEDLANRLFPLYKSPQTVFLKEEALSDSIASEGALHVLANAFFIECSLKGELNDVLQITSSVERGGENALLTIVRENVVEKRAVSKTGISRLRTLDKNIRELRGNGIKTVYGELVGDKYIMPYFAAETGQKYLKRLLFTDREKFVLEMDAFREMILNSSEHVKGDVDDAEGVVLSRGYTDMIPLNSFRIGHDFVVFDQEFYQDDCPANFIITRMVLSFYAGNENFNNIIPVDFFLKRYKLDKNFLCWLKMTDDFIVSLRNMNVLEEYTKKHRCDDRCVSANRARMNIPQCTYDKHMRTMLDKAVERKLILFGAGRFARSFLSRFGHDYPVYAIIDNNESRHGGEVDGVKIYSPRILKDFSVAEYKIIICVKDYEAIAEQLEKQGIFFYGIYNPMLNYSSSHLYRKDNTVSIIRKKYHTGYIAGVFDLFHIGHLNMFRRAKEQCQYLIVGVVSDKQVREGKKVEPFVPFEERLDMVRSCRYVDEAHEIPFEHPDTDMAWTLYHFDVQFSGSDYEHDPAWLAKKKWLEERGSTLVFFPYTQNTSSTRLKKLIEERLI